MRIRAVLCFLCITALAAGLVYAAPPGQIRVQVNLVNLFATVRDKHKAIVTGLKKDDFQVFEDGQLQEITNFSAESNLPITLGHSDRHQRQRGVTCSPRKKKRRHAFWGA